MGVREAIDQRPLIGAAAAAVVILLAGGFMLWQATGESQSAANPNVAFFTDDDGHTWFAAHVSNVPPFAHNGKQAVRAYVYRCGRGEPFVNHMERYTESARQVMLEAHAAPRDQPMDSGTIMAAALSGREIKRPGDEHWSLVTDSRAITELTVVNCPDGVEPIPVYP